MSAGEVVMALVPDLPDTTRDELLRLLMYFDAAPSDARWRFGRLGLLTRLLLERDGDLVPVRAYDARCRADGASWPSASQLSRSYGSWLRATEAASWLAREQRKGPAPRRAASLGVYRMFTLTECVAALDQSRQVLGEWPTRADYHHWYRLTREVRRRFSGADKRLPCSKVVERKFGTWHDALTYADQLRS